MIEWTVSYWRGRWPLRVAGSSHGLAQFGKEVGAVMSWGRLPSTGVVQVDIHVDGRRMGLRGMDNYWLSGRAFGSFNDPENADIYDGPQAVAWRIQGGQVVRLGEKYPPSSAHVLRGVQLPDDVAETIGLL